MEKLTIEGNILDVTSKENGLELSIEALVQDEYYLGEFEKKERKVFFAYPKDLDKEKLLFILQKGLLILYTQEFIFNNFGGEESCPSVEYKYSLEFPMENFVLESSLKY